MEADQILATGGASGITATIIFLLYKFCQNRHIRSKCCGKEIDIDTQVETPKINPLVVDEEQGITSSQERMGARRVGTIRSQNQGRTPLEKTQETQPSDSCSRTDTTTPHIVLEPISKPLQSSDDS